jgi:uncharacterized membrane protein
VIALLQVVLIVGYALLAHLASARHHDGLALAAMGCLVAMLLLPPLADRRWWAWLLLPPLAAGSWWLYRHGHGALPLLLAPPIFTGLIGWMFARSLRAGRTPLITRIVCGLDRVAPAQLDPAQASYTRGLTAAWAWLLAGLTVVNLLLALIARPDGLLASLGVDAPISITTTQWSWFANLLNYGILGGFFFFEFQLRKRRFPGQFASFPDFLRKLAGLGPAFWRDFLR